MRPYVDDAGGNGKGGAENAGNNNNHNAGCGLDGDLGGSNDRSYSYGSGGGADIGGGGSYSYGYGGGGGGTCGGVSGCGYGYGGSSGHGPRQRGRWRFRRPTGVSSGSGRASRVGRTPEPRGVPSRPEYQSTPREYIV
jgi:hypothetical protein